MIGTVGTGESRRSVSVPDKEFHGSDFRLLLESMRGGMSFTDLDDRGRAHCIGLLQGLILARSMKLAGWDLESPLTSYHL